MTAQTVHIVRESRTPDRIHRKGTELGHQCLYVALLTLVCLVLTSCSSKNYNHIRVLSPEPKANFEDFVRVDSLRPTFEWEPILSKDAKEPDLYAFGIWEFLGIRWYKGEKNWTIFGQKDTSMVGPGNYYGPGYYSTRRRTTKNLAVVVSRRPCYTKHVEGCRHTIESSLKPDTKYVWSVRPGRRTDKGVSWGKWGTYNSSELHYFVFASETVHYKRCAFSFMTPAE